MSDAEWAKPVQGSIQQPVVAGKVFGRKIANQLNVALDLAGQRIFTIVVRLLYLGGALQEGLTLSRKGFSSLRIGSALWLWDTLGTDRFFFRRSMLTLQRLQWAGLIGVVELGGVLDNLGRNFLCRLLRLSILNRPRLGLGVNLLDHALGRQPVHDLGHNFRLRHASGRDADVLGQLLGSTVALRARFGAGISLLPRLPRFRVLELLFGNPTLFRWR